MAKTKAKATEATADDEDGKGKRGKLVMGAVAVVALAAGAYVMVPGGEDAGAAGASAEEAEEPVEGEVVPLEAITLNLADGRFLKVGLALQLVEGVTPPAEAEVAGYAAPALDEAISLLGSLTYDELVAPGARDKAKSSLSQRVAARYEDDVMGVYFTEFVMQ